MPPDENGKFGFLAKLNPVAQIIIAIGIAVGIITIGVICVYIWIQPQLDKLHNQDESLTKNINSTNAYIQKDQQQSSELRKAILEDPKFKVNAPAVYQAVKKHTLEDEQNFVRNNSTHTPYFMDVDNLMSAGYIEVKDKSSKFIKLPYIEDVFIVYPDNAFPHPADKLEVTFAEDDININFKKKVFEEDVKYKPLLRYIPPIEKANKDLWEHYRHIKEREKADEKVNSN